MRCPNCGKENTDEAIFCTNCGQRLAQPPLSDPPQQPPPPHSGSYPPPREAPTFSPPSSPVYEHIPNYLVQAILVTVCCCLPAGIVSIVFAAQVNGKIASGDIIGARRASESAKTWAWAAFWLQIVSYVILVFIALVAGVA